MTGSDKLFVKIWLSRLILFWVGLWGQMVVAQEIEQSVFTESSDSHNSEPVWHDPLEEPNFIDDEFFLENLVNDPMSQVTSVSQLRDITPGDWAFEALRNLTERYNCLAGYPDGTYRGNQALTRFEFATALNACLGKLEQFSPEDLTLLQRLQTELATELAILRGRLDGVESRTADLARSQFSTTTTLNSLVFLNLTGAFTGGDIRVEATVDSLSGLLELRQAGRNPDGSTIINQITDNPEITFSNLVWLSLNTSFTGKDTLSTQLAAGNGLSPANEFASAGLFNTFGTPFTDQTAGSEVSGSRNDVVIREFFYQFPVGDRVDIVVGPRVNWYRYFDGNPYTFILTGGGSYNSTGSTLSNSIDRGSGAILLWDINEQLNLNVGYLGENSDYLPGGLFQTSSDPAKGLFGGTNTTTVELTYSPTENANIRLFYNYSHLQAILGTIGGATGEPIYGIADAGPGVGLDINPEDGGLQDSWAHTIGINFDWRILSNLGLFGRYTYGSTNLEPIDEKVNAQSIQAGFALPDLGKEGALATLSFLIPFDVLDGSEFLAAGAGDGGTQYEIEASYFYPLSENFALVSAFYWIENANNFEDNPSIQVGNLRAQFSF